MAGLNAKTTAILTGSKGDVRALAAKVQSSKTGDPLSTSGAIVGLQQQIDQIVQALAKPGRVTEFDVTDSSGSLIAWLGTAVANGVNYFGGWFRQLYIGGTSPADAAIVADQSGNVAIDGATLTLVANGVTTAISNAVNPWSSQGTSLDSTDNATGYYAEVDPFHIGMLTSANVPIAYMANVIVGPHGFATLSLGNTLNNYNVSFLGGAGSGDFSDGVNTTTILPVSVTTGTVTASVLVAAPTANFNAIPVYANNAAALIGGLVVGDAYRTGADPDFLAVVH